MFENRPIPCRVTIQQIVNNSPKTKLTNMGWYFFIERNPQGKNASIFPKSNCAPFWNGSGVRFQQDGCPAHNTVRVREYLRTTFGIHVISGYGSILWPARS